MKSSRSFFLNATFALAALSAVVDPTLTQAAPLTRDLGEGLIFYRAEMLPTDLPSQVSPKKPAVLDLRFAKGDAAAATALDGWLKFNASARTPIFLLINAETDAGLLAPLAARLPATGVVLIGTSATGIPLDIILKVPPAEERRAYDALRNGVTVDSLLNDSPDKARNDEARLAKDRKGDNPDTSTLPSDDPLDDIPGDKTVKTKAPAPVIDMALQRAVQLHRSLKALKRL